ncbi:MAG: AAA-type ATPase lid domain-containing protein [Planctomycetota bacterium]|jgi:cell division GTPase FtsZ
MRQTEQRPVKNEKKAEGISGTPAETEEKDLILALQKARTHNSCFEKPEGQGAHTDPCFSREYPGGATDEFEIDDGHLPALDLEHFEPDIDEETGIRDEVKGSVRYAWIGAGQCGGGLVKSFYDLGYRKVLAVNTTRRDLDSLDIPQGQKFLMDIGEEGTGRDMERGARAVRQHRQDILHLARQTFGTGIDHIMVCFGAGGGAGGGSVVELIEIAKRYARYIGLKNPSKSVGVVMTLPAAGKVGSPVVAENAYKVSGKLSEMATAGEISPLIIVDNDKINRMCPGLTVKSFWLSINNTVAGLFNIFNRLSALGSRYTSFDPLDYLSIIKSGGCLIMGRTKVKELDDPFSISEAVKKKLEKTLFAGGLDLSTVKACGCIVVGGKGLMANVKGLQDNINYAFDVLSEVTGEATIHRGIYEDGSDCLRVYTIIGGLNSPTARLEQLKSGLYFRPEVVDIEGLPLRERREDILPLAEYFLAKEANTHGRDDKILSSDSAKLLLYYSWPGNVRELAKAMERAHELAADGEIQPDALPFEIIFNDSEIYPKDVLPALDGVRRRIVSKALDLFRGRQDGVARILGIERGRLNHLIEKLNIPVVERNTGS